MAELKAFPEHRGSAVVSRQERVRCQDIYSWGVRALIHPKGTHLIFIIALRSYLQFGSPHSMGGQAQFVAAEREEIYVNPGYRRVLYHHFT